MSNPAEKMREACAVECCHICRNQTGFERFGPVFQTEGGRWAHQKDTGSIISCGGEHIRALPLPAEEWLPKGAWPTKPGKYWLNGLVGVDKEPETYLVEVRDGADRLWFIMEGNFLYERDVKPGARWCPAYVPEPPEMESEE